MQFSPAEGPVQLFDAPVRILVVDDDAIMREFAISQLGVAGVTVVTAADGEEGWAALERFDAFDIVLCDLEMPKLDGFGLLQRIRLSERHLHLPVVVITVRGDMFAVDRAYDVGATSFVTKPVNWRLLGYQLRYVLRASRHEAEVRKARDEAERAADLKNRLLTLIQHETRTPLHGLIGYSEILQNAGGTPVALRDQVTGVLGAAWELNNILRRIFFFAQLSAGTLPIDNEVVKLGHIVNEVVCSLRNKAAEAGVRLRVEDAGAGEIKIGCDVRYLSNAVSELLANAIRHSPRGAEVEISLQQDASGAPTVEIKDHGPGLDGAALQQYREAFVQAGDSLTRNSNGLGLGLATAQRIIELHGGSLDLTSKPGEGTSARLVLAAA